MGALVVLNGKGIPHVWWAGEGQGYSLNQLGSPLAQLCPQVAEIHGVTYACVASGGLPLLVVPSVAAEGDRGGQQGWHVSFSMHWRIKMISC